MSPRSPQVVTGDTANRLTSFPCQPNFVCRSMARRAAVVASKRALADDRGQQIHEGSSCLESLIASLHEPFGHRCLCQFDLAEVLG